MKTLHLTNAWHETSGGIATFYRALMDRATLREQQIRLVVPAEHDGIEDYSAWARIYHIHARRAPLNPSYRIIYPPAYLYPRSAIQTILAAEQPDLVEVCDKYNLNYLAGCLRQRLLGNVKFRPTVVGLTCERMDENVATYLGMGRLGRLFSSWYMHWLYFPFFDHHIAISSPTAEELRSCSQGHPVGRGVWIRHMGVELSTFTPRRRSPRARQELLARFHKGADCHLLIYVGRLAREKNLELLLETMRQLDSEPEDFRLLIAGSGDQRPLLERAAQQDLPGKVEFLGYIGDRNELANLLASCDIFLHPNPNEPFGIAPLEAMASGLPLVAPNSGGILDFARDSNAYVVAPTGAAFSRAVLEAIRNPELRKRKVASALSTAASFSLEAAADSFLSLYERIHAVNGGKVALEEAAPFFCSQPPGSVGAGLTKAAAGLCGSGFRAYVDLRTRLLARERSNATPNV